jgi:hypothetical protein
MLFGLCSAHATLNIMMNDILRDFLHTLVIVYFDDVCVYSRTMGEHLEHLRLVLQRINEKGLKLNLKKCFFDLNEIKYLGYTLSNGKISVSSKKFEVVKDWQAPTTHKFTALFISATTTRTSSIILATLRVH